MMFVSRTFRMCVVLMAVLVLLFTAVAHAHHFKGLPHFNYFENYPQVPQDEFLAQEGEFEFSLVVYDFQGIKKSDTLQPDDIRLYLAIYNLRANKTYKGAATLEVLCDGEVIHKQYFKHSEEESLYATQEKLTEVGDYSLRVTMHDVGGAVALVPFVLSSQKTNWGIWVSLILFFLIVLVGYGSRKARLTMDRKQNVQERVKAQKQMKGLGE